MLRMDILLIRLVYFCSLSGSLLASHEHSPRPYRPDINPDMDLMPLTRYRPPFTTSRPMTIRDPMLLPVVPLGTSVPPEHEETVEYVDYNYEDYDDFRMTSSGQIHEHVEMTTPEQEEEYVYTDAGASNAQNEYFMNDAAVLSSRSWIAVASASLLMLLL